MWNGKSPLAAVDPKFERIPLRNWPALMLRCKSCWLLGKNLAKAETDLTNQGDSLMLEHGLIETSKGRMTARGQWKQGIQGARSSLKGKLLGSKFDETTASTNITTPLKGGPYNVDFDLYWHGQPWW